MGRLFRVLAAMTFVVEIAQLPDMPIAQTSFRSVEKPHVATPDLDQVRAAPSTILLDRNEYDPNRFMGEISVDIIPAGSKRRIRR
jgi:hypothetical protein